MDFGVLAEYAHSLEDDGDDALELGLLGEKQFASTVLTANLLSEREFAGGAETEMEYAARYRWRVSQAFEPGIEFYGELGDWGANGSLDDHEHQVGPVAAGQAARRVRARHSSTRPRCCSASTHDSPDTTVRFLLEYEFSSGARPPGRLDRGTIGERRDAAPRNGAGRCGCNP